MNQTLTIPLNAETPSQALVRKALTPECLSAVVLTTCEIVAEASISDAVNELTRQTAAINRGDMSRPESMLMAQAHTLDGIFAKLACKAMVANHSDTMEKLLRLALKAQNQSRATLQTLAELKVPKQVAFVRQANIGNQVQVNNGTRETPTRPRKTKKAQNELLEVAHGERLDTRAPGSAGSTNPAMETVAKQHGAKKPGR